jgi:hypothetical protein
MLSVLLPQNTQLHQNRLLQLFGFNISESRMHTPVLANALTGHHVTRQFLGRTDLLVKMRDDAGAGRCTCPST